MKEIKNKYTQFQLLLEVAGILMLLSMVIFLLIRYNSIPDVIPTHFNGAGEIDKWGRKSQILIIPIVGIFLYLFVTGISLYPSIWNIPCKITKKK